MIELPELESYYADMSKGYVIRKKKGDFPFTASEGGEIIRRCKAYEGLVEVLNNLSKWAAAIHWNRKKNTQDWMDGLKVRIEKAEQALAEAK